MSLAKRRLVAMHYCQRADSCQPAGTSLPVDLTAARVPRCGLSKGGGGKHSPALSSQPERYRIWVCEDVGDTEMETLNYPALLPVEIPVGLTHLDSDFCWCDPIVEVDEMEGTSCCIGRSPGAEFHNIRKFTKQGPPNPQFSRVRQV